MHRSVIVIGGGQAGLACGYWLRRAGIDYAILDDQEAAGGAWQHAWSSLRLFSPAEYSSLPGWPMPKNGQTFPQVDHVLDYLTEYERRYELAVIRPVRVQDVTSDESGIQLSTTAGAMTCDYLISATGTWSAPFVPQVEGAASFVGRQLHSAHYTGPVDFAGQRVVVVGGGNSGVQITADLLGTAAEVTLASTTRLRFLPDEVDGHYLFKRATARLPGRHRVELPESTEDAPEGPSMEDAENAFVGNIVAMPSVVEAREAGALRLRAMFDRMTPTGAVIGRDRLDFDSVIWCTGYRPALRHLRSLRLRSADGRPEIGEDCRALRDGRVCFVGYGDWTGPASATLIGVGRTAKRLVAEIEIEREAGVA